MQQLAEIQKAIETGDFRAALSRLADVAESEETFSEALYMQAVCYRYLAEYAEALQVLERLKTLCPDHGRAHQEEGHTRRAQGDFPGAQRAYERASYFNPALAASIKGRIDIAASLKQDARRHQAQAQLDQLAAMPKPLVAVMDLISQGKLLKAEELCKQFMRQVPHNVDGMRLLAEIATRFGVLEEAEYLLESAVELEPANTSARIDYVRALRKRQQYGKALIQAQLLADSDPSNIQFKSLSAIENMQSGNFGRALSLFDEVLEKIPADPVTLTSRGHALKTMGNFEGAVISYRDAIESNAGHGEAYYSLANLKTYEFTETELAAMQSLAEDSNLSFMDRVYINFALGKAFEDRGEPAPAFSHYEAGNRLKKSQSRYRAEQMSEELGAQKRLFSADFIQSRVGSGHTAPDPIFILGLPRAGSTLLEQILSSHSQVDGTLELPNVLSLSQKLRRMTVAGKTPGYPAILEYLSADDFVRAGKDYIEDTRCHRQGAPRFIDKMPNNFRHIGLIKLMLPNARIIDARRNPLDCCWSGYKQLFAEGQEFSYDLSDLGQYYRDYVALMDHWESVFPGSILRVNNEDVITDLEGQVRRMLAFCDLPFEATCLNFHVTERNVRTPSAQQVRRPVSRSGVAAWASFEDSLGPLKQALGEELVESSYGVRL